MEGSSRHGIRPAAPRTSAEDGMDGAGLSRCAPGSPAFPLLPNACIAPAMKLIVDTASLAQFCQVQAGADFVAVDTEFMRDKTFWPILCLVQIAGPEEAAIIDALAPGIDLAPLLGLLAEGALLKVFH